MKKVLAAIAISLFCAAALAEPCMDANVSPTGLSNTGSDLKHLAEHGC